MVLTAAAPAAPAGPLRRSQRVAKVKATAVETRTKNMAATQKDDIQDTYVSCDASLAVSQVACTTSTNIPGRWSFLEHGINSVMLKLDEGVDMKTVCAL